MKESAAQKQEERICELQEVSGNVAKNSAQNHNNEDKMWGKEKWRVENKGLLLQIQCMCQKENREKVDKELGVMALLFYIKSILLFN